LKSKLEGKACTTTPKRLEGMLCVSVMPLGGSGPECVFDGVVFDQVAYDLSTLEHLFWEKGVLVDRC
jgi:hypothetical protein